MTTSERAELHEPLPDARQRRWESGFLHWEQRYFPNLVGLELEDVRLDYARMRLPHRAELDQPAGVVHGGAVATLIDTVVVPAIGGAYDESPVMMTVDMQVRYLGAARQADLVAEGWVTKRGRSIVFCQVDVRADPGDDLVAQGWLTYRVVTPSTPST